MPPINMKRSSMHYFTKMLEKAREGMFEKGSFGYIGKEAKFQGNSKNYLNIGDRVIGAGDRSYVVGCGMPDYSYEEAAFMVENNKFCINLRPIADGESENDRYGFGIELIPYKVVVKRGLIGLFFAPVKLSDDYNGSDDYYYAKPYVPNNDEKKNWFYAPSYITCKMEDNATCRILDGSNLPWRYLYPDYYNARKKKYGDTKPPRVALALMRDLKDPVVPHGQFIAEVSSDKTLTENDKDVPITINTIINGEVKELKESAYSPLSAAKDSFRKGQKVLVAQFRNIENKYVIINAEC